MKTRVGEGKEEKSERINRRGKKSEGREKKEKGKLAEREDNVVGQ